MNGNIDPNKYWFNVDGFVRDPAQTPTSFNTRAFPFQIDGLRGPGLTYVNLNIQRNFGIGGRRTLQARFDIQNLLNYAAFGNPNTDPTNTNFGKVVSAVSAAGAMRFFNFGLRFTSLSRPAQVVQSFSPRTRPGRITSSWPFLWTARAGKVVTLSTVLPAASVRGTCGRRRVDGDDRSRAHRNDTTVGSVSVRIPEVQRRGSCRSAPSH